MATFYSDVCASNLKGLVVPASAGVVVCQRGSVSIPNTHAADDVIQLCKLPKECTAVDFALALEELDSNASDTLTYDVGVLNSDGDGLVTGTKLISAAVSDADTVQRVNIPEGLLAIGKSDEDRIIAMVITAGAATKAAGAGIAYLSYISE